MRTIFVELATYSLRHTQEWQILLLVTTHWVVHYQGHQWNAEIIDIFAQQEVSNMNQQ